MNVKWFKEIKSDELDIPRQRHKSLVWSNAEDQTPQGFVMSEEEEEEIKDDWIEINNW